MTAKSKNTLEKAIATVSVTVITILLAFIAWMGNQGLTILTGIAEDNLETQLKQVRLEDKFESTFKYETHANTVRSQSNEKRIISLEEKNTDGYIKPKMESTIR